ncbi:MAG: tRNA pseudouridine(55) synthase TruB [Schlesneria sp.]
MTLCGVLNVDKPAGLTSRDVVNQIVRIVRPAKVGHAGTLDPLATGVLVVCVGHATRLVSLAQEGRKRYLGRFLLGQTSDTDDNTGNVVEGGDWKHVTFDQIASLLTEFTGCVDQVPPQFSAIHVQGQRAYDLARRGESVDLASRPVEIFSIRITQFCLPEFELEIECGSGTYIRSIGRDLGSRLGCGAMMTQLRRLGVGPFDVSDAVSLDRLTPASINEALQPALTIASNLRQRHLSGDEVIAVRRGQSIRDVSRLTDGHLDCINETVEHRTALVGPDGSLIGIGELDPVAHRLHPRIVFPN